MKLRASYWTWKLINNLEINEQMLTAYLMLDGTDGKCVYDCAYCTHARTAESDTSYLSRITWKEIELAQLIERLDLFKRICFQTVNYIGYKEDLTEVVKKIRESNKDILISVSTRVSNIQEIDEYIDIGVNQIGIAIDVASKELHKKYRMWDLDFTLSLIRYGSKKYPGSITTHIIVGLGESDRDIYEIFRQMKELGVQVALFAFTPIKKTKLEKSEPPSLERYRMIQILRYLIFEKDEEPEVEFDENGNIKKIGNGGYELQNLRNIERAFHTSGCSHCTRPYYNDKPGKKDRLELYNIHKLED